MGEWIKKHGPEIAIVSGMVTIIGAGIGACFATAAAVREVDRLEQEKGAPLTGKERFKVMLPYYIGPAAGLVVGGSLAIGGVHGGWVRTHNIAQAARLAEDTLQAHKDAAIDVVGEKKANEIDKEATIESGKGAIRRFLESGLPILGKGETYFVDEELLGDRIFLGDIQTIRANYNTIGQRMLRGGVDETITCKELRDVYEGIDIPAPGCMECLEYGVSTTGIPEIDIVTDPQPDSEGRIIHHIQHLNHPRVARYY